jgi:hypothetical protein
MFSRWFRSSPSPFQTDLAMVGAKAGDRLLIAGASRPELAAELAGVTGLNGSTTVADPSADAAARIDRAAREAGVLIEFRLLRPGGRLVVIDGRTRPAALGRLHHEAATLPPDEIITTLRTAGGEAVRLLATAHRISYFEARGAGRFPTD